MSDYNIPEDLRYNASDEWAKLSDDSATIGVSDYAQQQLGDVVFVELPEVGSPIEKGSPFGVIESVKAVSDLYAPLSGTVTEINEELADHPEHINEDCYAEGWLIKIQATATDEFITLFDAEAYRANLSDRSS